MSTSSYVASDSDAESSESNNNVATVASATSSISQSSGMGNVDEGDVEEYCLNCCPTNPETFIGKELSANGKCCQVCLFEGRPIVQKNVVVCKAHRVRVCADIPVGTATMVKWLAQQRSVSTESLNWFCPTPDATCWEKLHHFYVPNGLFPNLKKLERKEQEGKLKGFCNAIKKSAIFRARKDSIAYYESKGNKFKAVASGSLPTGPGYVNSPIGRVDSR